MKKIITVTGPDGSGKDTLIKSLSEHFPNSKVVTIWDLLLDPNRISFHGFKDQPQVQKYLMSLDTHPRLLFLLQCMLQAITDAQKSDATLLIINANWYKYAISEIVYGSNEAWVRKVSEMFPKENKVIFLDAHPEITVKRKSNISSYESGGNSSNRDEGFIKLQKSCYEIWTRWSVENKWAKISATQAPEDVFKNVLKELEHL